MCMHLEFLNTKESLVRPVGLPVRCLRTTSLLTTEREKQMLPFTLYQAVSV